MRNILKQIEGKQTSFLTIIKRFDNGNAYEAGETMNGTLFIRPLRKNGHIYEWQEFEKEYTDEAKFLKAWNGKK